jgi:hypothetical protein
LVGGATGANVGALLLFLYLYGVETFMAGEVTGANVGADDGLDVARSQLEKSGIEE